MPKWNWRWFWLAIILFFILNYPSYANYTLNMPFGVTSISQSIYRLHMTIFIICVIIGIVVFSILFFSLFKYRYTKNAQPANFHESTLVETIWTIIPLLILVGMAIPATKTLQFMYDDQQAELRIKITGYQWRWKYDYMDSNFGFFSNLSTTQDQIHDLEKKDKYYLREVDNPLVIPTKQKIRLLFTANDVIHSWWVPSFGIKKDAIPGFINESWMIVDQPGIYRGQCAELCGVNHGYMPIVVIAKNPQDFHTWLQQQTQKKQSTAGVKQNS